MPHGVVLLMPLMHLPALRPCLHAAQDPRCMHLAAQQQSTIGAGGVYEWLAASHLEGAPETNLFRCRVLWLDQVRWLPNFQDGSWMLLRDAAAGFHELRMLYYSAAPWAPQQLPDALLSNYSKLVVLHLRAINNTELSLQVGGGRGRQPQRFGTAALHIGMAVNV
jgi:hypothetical protein